MRHVLTVILVLAIPSLAVAQEPPMGGPGHQLQEGDYQSKIQASPNLEEQYGYVSMNGGLTLDFFMILDGVWYYIGEYEWDDNLGCYVMPDPDGSDEYISFYGNTHTGGVTSGPGVVEHTYNRPDGTSTHQHGSFKGTTKPN